MATEGEGTRRARERMRRGIIETAAKLMPALLEQRDREQATIDKAVAEDEFGYVWWHHRESAIRRRGKKAAS